MDIMPAEGILWLYQEEDIKDSIVLKSTIKQRENYIFSCCSTLWVPNTSEITGTVPITIPLYFLEIDLTCVPDECGYYVK